MGGSKDERDQRQELDDLNMERGGHEVGRMRRFLHDRDPECIEDKKREDERKLSALMQMMRDPVYRASYEAAWSAYDDAQTAVDEALIDTAEAIERLIAYTEEMDSRAHRLGDEAVFQDESGRFFRADGSALSDEELARVERCADAPSFEARRQAGDALEAAQARRANILEIQATILDPARDRLGDEDNPMSLGELREFERELRTVSDRVAPETLVSRFGASAAHEEASIEANVILSLDELNEQPAPAPG